MRILLAAPDRDLLGCYGKLLAADVGETVTAFDGTQVLSLLGTEHFDVAVIDCSLPRVKPETLAGRLKEHGIPVVVLDNGHAARPYADAQLYYPFNEEDLVEVITNTAGTGNKSEVKDE
jgi:DNA-binding response OmpR family regulator